MDCDRIWDEQVLMKSQLQSLHLYATILSSYGIRKFVERIPRKIQSQLVRVAKAHSLIEDIIMNKGMFDLHSQIFSAMFSHPAVSWIFRKNSMDSQESKFVQDKIVEIGTNKQIEENELVSR